MATEVQLAFSLSWTQRCPAMETSKAGCLNRGRTCKLASSNGRGRRFSLEMRVASPTPIDVEMSLSIRGICSCTLFRRGLTHRRLTWILSNRQTAAGMAAYIAASLIPAFTLCRPSTGQSGKTSPLVGTWTENSNLGQGCIHIAEQAPGEFTGWSDDIQLPGTVRSCIDGVSKPVAVFQRFGERLKAQLEKDGSVSFELYAYTGMCCSHTFVGKLTEDKNLIRGTWPSGANQAAHDATWKKMPGDSCVASDSEQAAEMRVK